MIDPITALSVASTAVGQMRQLINAGRDTTQAMSNFAAKKKAQSLKTELENMIRFVHGPTGLEEYKQILRDMKKQKEKTDFKKAKMKQAIIEWVFGFIIFVLAAVLMAFVFWFVGKQQGKW